MSSGRETLVTGALLLQESAWLVGLFGVLSLAIGGMGSPVSWFAVLAVMVVSLMVAHGLSVVVMPPPLAYGLQMLVGVAVVYVMVGAQAASEFDGVNLGWMGVLASGESEPSFTLRAVSGALVGAVLWWRGGRIGGSDMPAESLAASFKIGVVVLAVAAVVDIVHPADLNIFQMMFVFFAAGIAGLSVAHMAPAVRQATAERAWTKVIGGMVGVVVVVGLLFSLLHRDALAAIAAPILFVLNLLAKAVFYVIIVPLAYLVDFLVGGLFTLLAGLRGQPPQERNLTAPDAVGSLQRLQNGGDGNEFAMLLLQLLQWSLVAAIIAAALILMALAYKRRARGGGDDDDGERESLRDDADLAYDFANMLFNLIPSRFRRSRSKQRLRVPNGDANISDVFRIYFGMLMLAERRGHAKPSNETPVEYQGTLENMFPRRLVRMATAAFVRACYGHHPSTREEIEEMRVVLEQESQEREGK